MLGGRLQLKPTPVNLLSVVSKIFEKIVYRPVNMLDDLLIEINDCYFQYGFGSSLSTAELLRDLFNRITRTFNRIGPTQAVTTDIFKAFYKV